MILFYVGPDYLKALGRFARHGVANMDTLIGLGTGAAFVLQYHPLDSFFQHNCRRYLEINGRLL